MGRPASSYSRSTVLLHWIVAALVATNLVAGVAVVNLAPAADAAGEALAREVAHFHQGTGLAVLVLALVFLGHRLVAGAPPLPPRMGGAGRFLARCTNWGLYALPVLMPVAGWVMASADPRGAAVPLPGGFFWPRLPLARSEALHGLAQGAHVALALLLVVLLGLHIAGTLKHQFVDRDHLLERMLPWLRKAGT